MDGQLAVIKFIGGQGQVDPGYGVSAPPPGAVQLPVFPFDPTRPDHSLPGGGRPDNSLPGSQPGVDNSLPSYGHADNGLPVPGKRYVVKWLACHGLILVPDNSLPSGPPPRPSQGLPGSQPGPDNSLPGQPGRPDQGLPPTAQPKSK